MRTVKTFIRVGAWVALLLTFSVNQAFADTEPNNTLAQSNDLFLGQTMNGTLNVDPGDVSDWYVLTTSADGTLNVSFTVDPALVLTANVVRPNGTIITSLNSANGSSIQVDCISGNQTLYIHLQRTSGAGTYALTASMSSTVVSDVEPNNAIGQASETLEVGNSIQGSIGYVNFSTTDVNDYFLIDIPENGNVDITINAPQDVSTRLFLTRTNGSNITSTSSLGVFGTHTLEHNCIGAETYIVQVQLISTSVCGDYTLSFTLDTPNYVIDTEPNNSIGQVNQTITTGGSVSGQIGHVTNGSTDNSDYFLLDVEQNGTLNLHLETEDQFTIRLHLQRTNGSSINSGPPSGVQGSQTLSTECIGAGTYIAYVQAINGCGGYTLSFSVDEPNLAEDIEPNNSSGSIQETISEMVLTTGHLGHTFDGSTDAVDYFDFDVDRNGTVFFHANVEEGLTARLFVTRINGSSIFSSSVSGFTGEATFELPCFGEGTYVVYLNRISGCGSYSLTYEIEEPLYDNDNEPNNSIVNAQGGVSENETVSAHLGHVAAGTIDFIDYFTIQPQVNGTIIVNFNSEETLTSRFFLYRPNGSIIFSSPAEGFTGTASFSISCQAPDTYHIAVSRISGCGSYTFSYAVDTPEEVNDVEPNNTIALANETLIEGQVKEGQIGHQSNTITDIYDYYIVDKDRNGDVTFSIQTTNDNAVRLFVFAPSGLVLASSPAEGGTNIDLNLACRGIETMYVRVDRITGCGGYSLSYQIQDPVFDNDIEDNNSLANAQEVAVSEVIEGHLGYTSFITGADGNDYFRFTVVQAPFEFEATAMAADGLTARLWLQATNGSIILASDGAGFSDEETLSYTFANAGDYIFRISQVGGCGSYQVNGLCGVIPTASIDVDGSLTYCVSDEPTLIGNDDQYAYSWLYNGNQISTDQSIDVTSPGTYSLVTGDINECLSIAAEVEAEIYYAPGDYNFDGAVNSSDLLFLLGSFGCMQNCDTDLDGDDMVTSSDLLVFLTVFGTFCVTP